jgi:hypothetical protein
MIEVTMVGQAAYWHVAPRTKIWTLCGFSRFLRVLLLLYNGGRWRHNITCIRLPIFHSIISQLARGSITDCFLACLSGYWKLFQFAIPPPV